MKGWAINLAPWILASLCGGLAVWQGTQYLSNSNAAIELRARILAIESEPPPPPPIPESGNDIQRARRDSQELVKLRRELENLRATHDDLRTQASAASEHALKKSELQAEISRLQQAETPPPVPGVSSTDLSSINAVYQKDLLSLRELGKVIRQFSRDQNGRLPRTAGELAQYNPRLREQVEFERYEFLGPGSNPNERADRIPIMRTRSVDALGRRLYLFADGNVTEQKELK